MDTNQAEPPKENNQTAPKTIDAKIAASEVRKAVVREKVAFISVMIASFICPVAYVFSPWVATICALFFSVYALIFYMKANAMDTYLTKKYGLEKTRLLPNINLTE